MASLIEFKGKNRASAGDRRYNPGMQARRGSTIAIVVLALSVLTPFAYVGSYLALADHSGRLEMRRDGRCYTRQYRWGGALAEKIFWPAHFVDLQLRPGLWGVTSYGG